MCDALVHRGPDSGAVWTDPAFGLVLGHRRLAIIDLSAAGSQPMLSSDGRWAISYNGEIYNAEDMRRHPSLASISWRGQSDTEVILESIARRGLTETLLDMNGMFALAVWDKFERRLHLARDRLGIKPLFLARLGEQIAFASELKALRALGSLSIDPTAVASYLRFGYVPAPNSIYVGVEKIMPGAVISVDTQSLIQRRFYWRLSNAVTAGAESSFNLTDEDATERLADLLGDAVRRQMISDVPLGAFLSGGIDSSTVAALMASSSKGQVRTFSIGFPETEFDESNDAAAVARHLGTSHTRLVVSQREALDVVPRLAHIYDEPFADSSQIPTYLVSKLTREHVTVALTGDGGDELFAGYNRYIMAGLHWRTVERVPAALRRLVATILRSMPPAMVDAARHLGPRGVIPPHLGDKLQKVASVLALDANGLYRRLVSQIPDPTLHTGVSELTSSTEIPKGLNLIDSMRFADTLTYLPDDILQKVDRASMAVSLEARPPLLDHRIVEFAWSLPQRFLIRKGQSKWVLRRVLQRHVPRALFERPKMGFGVPLAAWLRGPLRAWAEELLMADDYGGGLLRPEAARDLWREHSAGNRNHGYQIWTLLMFEQWRRQWAS